MKQTSNEQFSVAGNRDAQPAKKKPVKEVDYTYKGYKYGVGIATIERSKEGAAPGYEKVTVTLQIRNRQTDRSAPSPLMNYGVATVLHPDSATTITGNQYDCSAARIKQDPSNCNLLTIQDPNDRGHVDSGGPIGANDTTEYSFDFTAKEGAPNSDFTIWLDVGGFSGREGKALPYPD